MRKPRKSIDNKDKRRFDKKTFLMLPIAASAGLIVIFIMNQSTPKILEECFSNDEQQFSIYIHLNVTLDNKPLDLQDNLGYNENCIKPIHLHNDNTVHVIYSREIRLTLFELLKIINLDINNYDSTIYVKIADNQDYIPYRGGHRALELSDGMNIKIELKSKS